ncbi:Dehydrogenase azaJ [Colletotrichum siamense]|nr:Dehydrogenase azaJ [Colletotrichum siamense]
MHSSRNSFPHCITNTTSTILKSDLTPPQLKIVPQATPELRRLADGRQGSPLGGQRGHPAASEILIRNRAVAVNYVEPALQTLGPYLFPWVTHPQIFGNDIAGEVVEVGLGVEAFKPGDRVVAHAINTIVSHFMAAPIPGRVFYEQACVLALALSTASCALYQKDQLALELPAVPARSSTDKTVLLWGGATSVGCCAVQLAVACGYEVVTVASPKNFGLLETLGGC